MPLFRYRAVSAEGALLQGEQEAADESAVIAWLQDQGHLPIKAEPAGAKAAAPAARVALTWPWQSGISAAELATLTQELARLLGAAVTLERSLQILINVGGRPNLIETLQAILRDVRGGMPLSDALEAQGAPFNRMYVNLVRAGEAGGALDVVLAQLADYLREVRELRATVIAAMIYPAVLFGVSILSLLLLLTFVVPQFEQLFAGAEDRLPLATRLVIDWADWLTSHWWALFAALLLALLAGPRLLKIGELARAWDRLLLSLPVFGPLIRKVEAARFSRTLGTLTGNGVPLLSALAILRGIVRNSVAAEAVAGMVEALKAGRPMSGALFEHQAFPPLVVQMIQVGEETGRLDSMLKDVADIYDQEIRHSLKKLLALLEPILILTLAVLIGGIVVSILAGVVSVNDLVL